MSRPSVAQADVFRLEDETAAALVQVLLDLGLGLDGDDLARKGAKAEAPALVLEGRRSGAGRAPSPASVNIVDGALFREAGARPQLLG